MEFVQQILGNAPTILAWVGGIYVAAVGINAALLPIVKLTATQADDRWQAKIGAFLEKIRGPLSKIGASLPKGK